MTQLSRFLNVRYPYNGPVKPNLLVFDANLQEFAQRVGLIVGLETGGKLSAEASYQAIESLWQELSESRRQLGIGES